MTLEERIKALMEGSQVGELTEKVTVKDKDGDEMTMGDGDDDSKDDDKEDDSSEDEGDDGEEGDDEEGDDDDTDFAKDKKNPIEVKEDASNEKLKAGLGKKDNAGGKLAPPPSGTGGKDPKNAKLTVGQGKKFGETGGIGDKASAAEPNATNNVDQQSLQVKPFKVTFGESMDALFQGEELSEEFQSKAATIFESAVNAIVEQRVHVLEEEFQVKLEEATAAMEVQLDEAVEAVQNELVENIDGFLNYAVEQWVEDNQVALESGIKVEMVTNFIDGLKTLFQENYIEVPEDKLDVVEAQAARISELEEALVAIDENNDQLTEEVVALRKNAINESVAKGLTIQQKDKFLSLVEGLEYTSDEEYSEKATTIKESYFKSGQVEQKVTQTETITESNSDVSSYVKALGSPLKFSK